jgi:hypothetical protein
MKQRLDSDHESRLLKTPPRQGFESIIHPFQVTKGVMMRGTDEASGTLFSYVDLEARVPTDHPLRKIRHIYSR